jgi:hypothetical protein
MTLLHFALPLGFMLIVYVGSLVAMLVNSFYRLNDITGKVVREFTLTVHPLPTSPIPHPQSTALPLTRVHPRRDIRHLSPQRFVGKIMRGGSARDSLRPPSSTITLR